MKKSLSILSLFMLVFSSIIPIWMSDAYYLNGNEEINYPEWTDITFYDVAWNERAIMSYNLWATSTDIEEEDSHGLFFQWGNNRGFPNTECDDWWWSQPESLSIESVDSELWLNDRDDELVVHDTEPGLPGHWPDENEEANCNFESDEFADYWNQSYSWSWSLSQWPCPSGYHVPSMEEWNNLFVQWCEDDEVCDTRDLTYYTWFASEEGKDYRWYFPNIGGSGPFLSIDSLGNGTSSYSVYDIVDRFTYEYNLPLAGFRNENHVDHVNNWWHYWTRTPVGDVNNSAWHFEMSSWWVRPNDFNTYNGESVRCFKDPSEEVPTTLALDLYEWGCSIDDYDYDHVASVSLCGSADMIGRVFVPENQHLSSWKIAKLDQYNWYTTNIKDNNYLVNLDAVVFTQSDKNEDTNTIVLYWFSKCEYWQAWDGQKCVCDEGEMDEESWQCVYEIEDIKWNTITIMTSNLWATDTNPLWAFYQWGNNYAFPRDTWLSTCELDNDGNGDCPLEWDYDIEWTEYYNFMHYYEEDWAWNWIPRDEYNWTEWEQWPCPNWYHVPTINEWNNLFVAWCEQNNECDARELLESNGIFGQWLLDYHWMLFRQLDFGEHEAALTEASLTPLAQWYDAEEAAALVTKFLDDMGLSLAGYRSAYGVYRVGSTSYYWSSTPLDDDNAWGFGLVSNFVGANYDRRDFGYSVRCFSDSYSSAPTTLALDLYRWGCGNDGDDSAIDGIAKSLSLASLSCSEEDRLWRKFIAANDGVIDTNKLTEIATQYGNLPAPGNWKQWVWYLVNEQDETQKITSSTRLDDNAYAYVFLEDKPADKPSWWNGGWYSGWGSSHSKWGGNSSDTKSVDNPTDNKKEETKPEVKPINDWGGKATSTGKVDPQQELFDAYKWAYANGLTKYANMADARLDDPLNRQEMAKISTLFATKFVDKSPNTKKRTACSQYSDLWKVTSDMEEFIIESCELGYMWYRANGVDYLERFRPYTPVSLAEFSIIISRIMWWNRYALNEKQWYQWHLHAVYENNLIDNITKPFEYITRRDAYLMLYRLSKNF